VASNRPATAKSSLVVDQERPLYGASRRALDSTAHSPGPGIPDPPDWARAYLSTAEDSQSASRSAWRRLTKNTRILVPAAASAHPSCYALVLGPWPRRCLNPLIVYSCAAVPARTRCPWHGQSERLPGSTGPIMTSIRSAISIIVARASRARCRYPADVNYGGEKPWYNPFTGALVALASWGFSWRPPHVLDVRLGPYLNLLVPGQLSSCSADGFRKVGLRCFHWRLFLFHASTLDGGQRVTSMAASYSPWLFAPHLSLAWFFFTLLPLFHRIEYATGIGGSLATGIMLLGITFLRHTWPAVVLGITIGVRTTAEAPCGQSREGAALCRAADVSRCGTHVRT